MLHEAEVQIVERTSDIFRPYSVSIGSRGASNSSVNESSQ